MHKSFACSWLLLGSLLACGGTVDNTVGSAAGAGAAGAGGGVSGASGQGGGGSSGASGQAGTAGAAGGASADLAAACRSFFERYQAFSQQCGGLVRLAEIEAPYTDSCVAQASLPGATLTPAKIDECAAQVAQVAGCGSLPGCVATWGLPMPITPGTLPTGAACQAPQQCASGLCSAFLPGDCGVCQQERAEGESCGQPQESCAPGLLCQTDVCLASGKPLGASCIDYGGGDCRAGLYCDAPGDALEGVCQPRAQAGQACDEQQGPRCMEKLYCAAGTCAAPLPDGASCGGPAPCQNSCHDGVCEAPHHQAAAGQDCSFHGCAPGLACSEAKVCEALPVANEGEDCQGKACAAGLLCVLGYLPGDQANRCVKVPAVGEPCVDLRCGPFADCRDVDYANQQPGRCVALGFRGDPCPCLDELICREGVCQPAGSQTCP